MFLKCCRSPGSSPAKSDATSFIRWPRKGRVMTARTDDTTCLHHLLALRSSWLTQKEANQGKLQLYTHEVQMRFSNAQCACARHYKFFTDGAWETQDARTHDNRTLYVVLTANSQTTHERQTSGVPYIFF